jgi:hypothetical protein
MSAPITLGATQSQSLIAGVVVATECIPLVLSVASGQR